MESNKLIAKFTAVIDRLDQKGTRCPGLILSHPGFGKTSTIRKFCEYMDYNLVTIIPSQSSSDDILGIQSVKDGNLVRLTPSWYNKMVKTMENGKRTLLFIDEISTCDPFIQGPLLDLIFSKNLGEKTLPDNVFIMAAGNYSEDLNSEFQMSAPLINRFLLLNLRNDDYSLSEVLDGTFDKINTKKEIEEYLGLETSKTPMFDFDKFKKWIINEKEVGFDKTTPTEDPNYGLIGFTSMRSLTYTLQFAEEYMHTFADDYWFRMVGDTLGYSKKRDKIVLTQVIDAHSSMFTSTAKSARTIGTIAEEINSTGVITDELFNELESLVLKTTRNTITSAEIAAVQTLSLRYSKQKKFSKMILHITALYDSDVSIH